MPGQFNLPKAPRGLVQTVGEGGMSDKPMPVYEIWSKSQNKMVGTATSLKSASRVIDRRDNAYGGYDHYKKKIGRD